MKAHTNKCVWFWRCHGTTQHSISFGMPLLI